MIKMMVMARMMIMVMMVEGGDDEDVLGDNYHCQRIGGREAGMAESNPGLWIPEEDTLATVYMTISRAVMMMIRVMITGVSIFCKN